MRANAAWLHLAGMEKSTFTPQYDGLRQRLRELREAAGLSQRDLAAALGREHSFVGRVEVGDRRVDLVEFCWIVEACGADPEKEARRLIRGWTH